ncbi:MAG: DUF4244 domain-containing protein [Acidimicrobiia bacterium]|nr:DUF4244 domain-containing protein [Acidimicrobiia bacterium]
MLLRILIHTRILRVRPFVTGERGQATAEYGLVMLAAAAIAGLLLAWATSTDAVGRIMDAVVASIIGDIGS